MSAIQGLLKYWTEWKDSWDFQNCPLSGVPLWLERQSNKLCSIAMGQQVHKVHCMAPFCSSFKSISTHLCNALAVVYLWCPPWGTNRFVACHLIPLKKINQGSDKLVLVKCHKALSLSYFLKTTDDDIQSVTGPSSGMHWTMQQAVRQQYMYCKRFIPMMVFIQFS